MNKVFQNIFDILKYILVILLIVALGIGAMNGILEYRYKAELLQKPCELCARLNTAQKPCIASCFQSYQTPDTIPNISLVIK